MDGIANISGEYGCLGLIDSYWLLWISLDSSVESFVDKNKETMEALKKEIQKNDDDIIKFVTEIGTVISQDIYKNDSIEDSKENSPDEIKKKLEEALKNFWSKNDLRNWKAEFSNEWSFLNKKNTYPYVNKKNTYPYDYFSNFDVHKKQVDNLQKGRIFH